MRHCYLVYYFNCKEFYADVSSFGPVSGVHALALVHVTSVHALVFTHALAGTHVLACVSQVVGSSVAGVLAL